MKQLMRVAACILLLLLCCSCKAKEQMPMEQPRKQTIVFINDVRDADMWILPETEKNLKTTVWGTASASGVKQGERRTAPLSEPGENGRYLFRMIDADGWYYSANGLTLAAGWTIRIEETGMQFTITVSDETGAQVNTYDAFAARL